MTLLVPLMLEAEYVDINFSSSVSLHKGVYIFSVEGNLINIIYIHCGYVSPAKLICTEIVLLLLPEFSMINSITNYFPKTNIQHCNDSVVF